MSTWAPFASFWREWLDLLSPRRRRARAKRRLGHILRAQGLSKSHALRAVRLYFEDKPHE
jgi:hypothetical protein